jgi:phosphoglycolate phosphatase-like HAD superfamily hydrolase
VAAEAAVLVGDMPIDAVTAANAGMGALLVSGGAAGEDELRQAQPLAVLSGLPEVAAWLLEHGRGWDYHRHPGRRHDV